MRIAGMQKHVAVAIDDCDRAVMHALDGAAAHDLGKRNVRIRNGSVGHSGERGQTDIIALSVTYDALALSARTGDAMRE
jgi:metal-dependent amidase/aminoacylase/carboxypeptidase family protein